MRLLRLFTATFVLGLAACGGSRPTPAPAAPAVPAKTTAKPLPAPARSDAAAAITHRPVSTYTKIDYAWVARYVVIDEGEMQRWGAANPDAIHPDLRHVLVKVPANATAAQEATAKKKASAILAQARKGADFAKLARTYSEDVGSKDRGGALPGMMVPLFVSEIQKAYASLAPGEVDKQLVRSAYGYHVVMKEKPSTQNVETAFRAAKAEAVAKEVADALAERLSQRAPVRSLEWAVRSVLGNEAAADLTEVVHGVVSSNDYRESTKLGATCSAVLGVAENDVELFAVPGGILVVRGDDGVPGRDAGEICPPADVEVASREQPVDTPPLLAVRGASLPRE